MVAATTRDVTNFKDFKLFKSIGPLIKDYRRLHKLSQEELAERIRISVRQLQRWEIEQRPILIENLHDLSEVTGIPMHVCVALNAAQPIWYSLEQRRFAYSSIEAQFLFHELFRYREQANDGTLLKFDRISTDKHINLILACHREIYGTETTLERDVLKEACRLLPDLNRIAFDSWGHYVGHNVCLPIKMEIYQQLKKQKVLEDYLTNDRMSDILALNEGCFFHYSGFGTSLNIVHQLYIDLTRYLIKIEQKEKYLIAVNTALIEAKSFFDHLGMRLVNNYERMCDKTLPKIYELELDVLMRPLGPCGWLLEKKNDKIPGDKSSSIIGSPNLIVDKLNLIVDKGKKEHPKERKTSLTLKIESCPNPECTSYDKTRPGNIVSNGTYRTKEGGRSHRFLCKECGKSFCSRTGTLFYDLRSSEDKVLMALKLLVKGMPLQGVAKSLEVNFNTVLHWLEIAAKKSGEIDGMLLKKLDVSQAELDTLWSIIQNNSRHRTKLS